MSLSLYSTVCKKQSQSIIGQIPIFPKFIFKENNNVKELIKRSNR